VKNSVDIVRLQQQLKKAQSHSSTQQQEAQSPSDYSSGRFQRSQSRIGNDFQTRDSALQMYTQKELTQQRLSWNQSTGSLVREGVSQPVWIGPQLLLARRVEMNENVVIQGCWLDWARLEKLLRKEVANLLPDVTLEPVRDPAKIKVSRMLATLPVQLVVPTPEVPPPVWSAMRISLATAWTCLLLAAVAVGLLLQGVLALSERRGAFVSAVTHELRTPLTTFRMYSEMLARDMVPDVTKRQSYLETLRVEADRLSHLVENVLAYARLERGRLARNTEVISVGRLLDRVEPRLQDRASQAEMKLMIEIPDELQAASVETDPAAVEQILFNLVDNACKYAATGADRRIHLQASLGRSYLRLRIQDHGTGILPSETRRLFRPFSKSADEAARSAPGVGLGLALCRRLAGELGGKLVCKSETGEGASFELALPFRR
jgi:signal transduction histidine kinase